MDEKRGYKSKKAIVSFVPPTAGMFVWLAVHLESHPQFAQIKAAEGPEGVNKMLYELWTELAEKNVSAFTADCIRSDRLTLLALLCKHRFSSHPGTSLTLNPVSRTRVRRTLVSSV